MLGAVAKPLWTGGSCHWSTGPRDNCTVSSLSNNTTEVHNPPAVSFPCLSPSLVLSIIMYLLWKHFHLCFFNLKHPTLSMSPSQPNRQEQSDQIQSVKSFSKSVITNEKSNLFSVEQQQLQGHSTCHGFAADNSSASSSPAYNASKSADDFFSSISSIEDYSDYWDTHLPDLASVYASQRFFFSSPGRSNSIVESPDTRPSVSGTFLAARAAGGVRVRKYSQDPYVDFKRSMQEMVEAREIMADGNFDWEYLHELLLCYLAMNPAYTHKHIIRAFSDLVTSILAPSSSASSSNPLLHQLSVAARSPRTFRSSLVSSQDG